MNNKKYETVLLDFDDTIVDLEGYWGKYVKEFSEKHALSIENIEILNDMNDDIKDRVDPKLFEEFKKENRRKQPIEIELLPKVRETLETLKLKNIQLGIVSNASRGRVNDLLTAKGMLGLFSAIVCKEDVVNVKPHPEPIQKALGLLNMSKNTALFVGDTFVDIRSGISAGVDTMLLISRRREVPLVNVSVPAEKPTYIINDFSELLNIA